MTKITDLETSEEKSKHALKQYHCKLLHEQRPFWRGEIIWNEFTKEWNRLLRWRCHICDVEGFEVNDPDDCFKNSLFSKINHEEGLK
jgi:hypothetical protein